MKSAVILKSVRFQRDKNAKTGRKRRFSKISLLKSVGIKGIIGNRLRREI